MIGRVHITNFKSLADVALDLGRLTVLVGPNGCGKSSLLQALVFAWYTDDLDDPMWVDLATEPRQPLTVSLFAADFRYRFQVDFQGDKARGSWILFGPGGASWNPKDESWQGAPERPQPMDPKARDQFKPAFLHPHAETFARPSRATSSKQPGIDIDGEGLASTLSFIAGYDPEAFSAISRDLGVVVPGAKRVRVAPAEVERSELEVHVIDGQPVRRRVRRRDPGHRFLIEFTDGRLVRSELVSEGTAIALGILTLLHSPKRPRLLLIDDIDRGLHIEAQARLVNILREILKLDPELQILCTTHSPYLLDLFAPAEVIVLALDEQRHTRAVPLAAHPEFERFRHGIETGELWATLGEGWVAKAAP